MSSKALFTEVAMQCSRITTMHYSTSFASAIRLLHKDLRNPIYAIYGFVRFADEIVDTFHEHDKSTLLAQFKEETFLALERKISLNPILHSFQETVHSYNIDSTLIEAFFHSMEMDLDKQVYYQSAELDEYIYGSAEVVGLMCLHVFCEGNKERCLQLEPAAQALGAAFQKVNFLRDLKADFQNLNRSYFPGLDFHHFDASVKQLIEADIEKDFNKAFEGIKLLPLKARFGVYVAYRYYQSLFNKIKKLQPAVILQERIRIPNVKKAMIVIRAGVKNQLNLI